MTNGLISAVTPHNKGRGGGNHPKTGKTNIEAVPLKKVKPIPRFYHAPVTPRLHFLVNYFISFAFSPPTLPRMLVRKHKQLFKLNRVGEI